MNKTKIAALTLAAVLSSAPVFAAEVPKEAVPAYLTEESVCITENLISPIGPMSILWTKKVEILC